MLRLAQRTFKFSLSIFTVVVLAGAVGTFANVASAKAQFIDPITWLINTKVLFIAIAVLLLILIASGATVFWAGAKETFRATDRALYRYLEQVVSQHASVSTKGFSQRFGSTDSISVPFQEVYYSVPLTADFPMNDVPQIPQYLLDIVASTPTLTKEDRDQFSLNLQSSRYVPNFAATSRNIVKEKMYIEELVKQLNAASPTGAILGTPGSGKTMIMRWLALQMALASLRARYPNRMALIKNRLTATWPVKLWHTRRKKPLSAASPLAPNYNLSSNLSPAQIPLLIYIKEYVSFLSERKRTNSAKLSLDDFLEYQFAKELSSFPALPAKISQELRSGHCLVLFDGIDEAPDDNTRAEVLHYISEFIITYKSSEKASRFNRFIINSRIFGYTKLDFVSLHYTVTELDRSQIKVGLKKWCDATLQSGAQFNKNRTLSPDEALEWQKASVVKYHELLAAIEKGPNLEQLAANPLMLTGIVLIHLNGQMLPQRRIELYNTLTETLLSTWNLERGASQLFAGSGMLSKAEQVLGDLAYYLHMVKPLLTKGKVLEITRTTLKDIQQNQQISDDDVWNFINDIGEKSSLFVESGRELYCFMHRTFQEYYVARYLLRNPDKLKEIVLDYYLIPRWREPLLLTIASLVLDLDLETRNREQASALIEAVLHADDPYEDTLHRGLLFATSCIIDCGISAITRQTQQHVAEQLFHIYGDMTGTGRYSQLREEIERLALLWLGTQAQSILPTSVLPGLLDIWRRAVANEFGVRCQQGAVQLLAALAPKLHSSAPLVRNALIPPLIQLAKLDDLPVPIELKGYFLPTPISTDSPHLEADAYIALHAFKEAGPAGWLYAEWLNICTQNPELLTPLTSYAIKLDYLLTPASIPTTDDSMNWQKLLALGGKWQKRQQLGQNEHLQKDYALLQKDLLSVSNSARYPMAHFIESFLKEAQKDPALTADHEQWVSTWDALLEQEMQKGRSATFYGCFLLRLLLCRRDDGKRRQLRDVLLRALQPAPQQDTPTPQQCQAFMLISYIYLVDLLNLRNLLEHLNARDLADVLKERLQFHDQDIRTVIKDMNNWYSRLDQLFFHDRLCSPFLRYLHNNLDMLDLGDIVTLLSAGQPSGTQAASVNVKALLAMREIRGVRSLDEIRELQGLLDAENIIDLLCKALEQPGSVHFYLLALLALHSVLTTQTASQIHSSLRAKTLASINTFDAEHPSSSDEPFERELTLLVKAIKHLISPGLNGSGPTVSSAPPRNEDADTRARYLQTLCTPARDDCALQADTLREILYSCDDTRPLSDAVQKQVEAATVQQVALNLLRLQYKTDESTFTTIISFLDRTHDPIIHASAALFLQFNKAPTLELSKEIARKVKNSLTNDSPSYRPLYILGNRSPRYLDDILFDTLRIMAEHIAEQEIETKMLQKAIT